MSEPESPTLARFVLGRMLRRLRVEAGVDVQTAAELCGVVKTTVIRWENGNSPPKPPMVKELGREYGATRADIDKMSAWALKAKRRGLFEGPDVPVDLRMLYEAEHVAHTIKAVELEHIPGLLQTPEYLAEVQSALPGYFEPDTLSRIIDLRERRQHAQSARTTPAIMQYLIGTAAMTYLSQMTTDVRKGQTGRLRDAVASGVDIRVLTKPHAAMLGSFTMIQISPDHPPFAYVESVDAGRYLEGADVLFRFEQTFDAARTVSTPLEEYLR